MEQPFLGHVMTQALSQLKIPSVRVGHYGHEANWDALLKGEIDLYAEYIGTALHRYVNLAPLPRNEALDALRAASLERHDVEWLDPIGSDNTYGLLLGRTHAEVLGVKTISDLAPHASKLTVIGRGRFINNDPPITFAPGGYEGWSQVYGLRFGKRTITDDEFAANFRAFQRGEGQVVADFVVHPQVELLDMVELEDDRQFFSNYYIAPVVRAEFLRANPQAREILQRMAWTIPSRRMARFNYLMDFEHRPASEIASEYLAELDLAVRV